MNVTDTVAFQFLVRSNFVKLLVYTEKSMSILLFVDRDFAPF